MHLGHSQGRSFFFEPHLLLHQKEVGQQTEGHVVVPASPAAHLVVAHAQVLLALLKTGFNRPATGREGHQFGQRVQAVGGRAAARAATVQLDVLGQGAGGGWYRGLRFGHSVSGPCWLPASAVSVTGPTTNLPQVPGAPGALQSTDLQGQVILTWSAPSTGGMVTGYRLWRQTGEAAWAALDVGLDAHTFT